MNEEESKHEIANVTSALSNGVQPKHQRTQNYSLIWIDTDIDETNPDCQNVLVMLRSVVNNVIVCTEQTQCIKLLNDMDHEDVFVVCSQELADHFVPILHEMPQVDAIYILGNAKYRHKPWIAEWTKVQGDFTSIRSLLGSLKTFTRECDHNLMPMSFVPKRFLAVTAEEENLVLLEPFFKYSLLYNEIISEIHEDDTKSVKDFVFYSNSKDISESQLTYFQNQYKQKSAVSLYTEDIFLRSMLHHALFSFNMETVARMSFFIRKLHQQLEELYKEQSSTYTNEFMVYRAQTFTEQVFQQLVDTKGGFIAFNNFLSTNKDKEIAIDFVERAMRKNNDILGVVFIMKIDPSKVLTTDTPFALIDEYNAIPQGKEILFTMNTVFRVGDIKQAVNNNRLWKVRLTMVDDNDTELAMLTLRMKKGISFNGWYELGQWMLHVGLFDQAEELYNDLLENAASDDDKICIYHELARAKEGPKKYEEAIIFYEKKVEIKQKTVSADDPSLASTYIIIGQLYDNIGNYSKALEFYRKSHNIYKKTLPPNHPDLGTSYSNIGQVYSELGDYLKSREYYDKAYKIWENIPPPNLPRKSNLKRDTGRLYEPKIYDSKMRQFYQRVAARARRTLPTIHRKLQDDQRKSPNPKRKD
ncbi:unnamed protein product [Rotaria magnacalcarata]|uniref:Uncharacterized protein n=1 Tax=Rotaria magnacalcarata TaxID=392030 RepID=A0A819SGQ9_9BILA|nr:unnamed protein product [Rotaria magnacalcarata]CAF4059225.1 unnamed protein product [Rotaria magnacalcarata]